MSYRLLYTKSAVKDIAKRDIVVKKQLRKKLEEFIKNPLTYATRLTDSKLGMYRLRIGNYRMVFDLDGRSVVVLRIRHRKEVYKN